MGSQWIDYFRVDTRFKFRNFTQNIPRADSYHGSDNTSALAGNTGDATPILDVSQDSKQLTDDNSQLALGATKDSVVSSKF